LNLAGYDQSRGLGSLGANDFVTKQILTDNLPVVVAPISAAATANITPVPLVVSFASLGITLPGYEAYDNTLNQYDNTIKVVISGTNISFYGIDNGAGNFLDNYTFLVFRH
jgi:hypothetical protein